MWSVSISVYMIMLTHSPMHLVISSVFVSSNCTCWLPSVQLEHSVICVQYIQKFVSGCAVVVTHYWQLKPGALSSISYNYHTFHFSEFHLVKPKLFLAEARCARAF